MPKQNQNDSYDPDVISQNLSALEYIITEYFNGQHEENRSEDSAALKRLFYINIQLGNWYLPGIVFIAMFESYFV